MTGRFLKYGPDEVFLDCGCFDGDTSKRFVEFVQKQRGASIGKIVAYEPDQGQFPICMENLKDMPFASVRNAAVWNKKEALSFTEAPESEGSHITNAGTVKVNAVALDDDLAGERVTFIKMDVEGAELNALRGAEKLIRANRPKLAICLYHKPEDIIELPGFVADLGLNYRLYLRHQSFSKFDTILYAVPG